MIKFLIVFAIIIIWSYLNIRAEMSHDGFWIKSSIPAPRMLPKRGRPVKRSNNRAYTHKQFLGQ